MTDDDSRTLSLHEALMAGIGHQRQGQHGEAAAIYRRILAVAPGQQDALHLLGLALLHDGEAAAGLDCIEQAIAVAPDTAVFHNSRGSALQVLDRHHDAAMAWGRALELDPDLTDAVLNLSRLLARAGRDDQARVLLEQALARRPDEPRLHQALGELLHDTGHNDAALPHLLKAEALGSVETRVRLGYLLYAAGRLDEADARFRQALSGNPRHADAHNGLGVVALARGRLDQAAAAFEAALKAEPDLVKALNNLAAVEKQRGNLERGAHLYQRALSLWPQHPEIKANYAVLLALSGAWADARRLCETALDANPHCAQARYGLATVALHDGDLPTAAAEAEAAVGTDPTHADSHQVLGLARMRQGDLAAGLTEFNAALTRDPDNAAYRLNRASCLLAMGRLAEGWPDYHRFRLTDQPTRGSENLVPRRPHPQPPWEGEDLPAGGRLLVWGEQGVADELWFASLLPELAGRLPGVELLLECDPRLVALMQRSFPDLTVLPRLNPPHPDCASAGWQLAMGDLPVWLRPRLADFAGARPPRLTPDPAEAGFWRQRLDSLGPGLKVGLSWRSTRSKGHLLGRAYPRPEDWAPLFAMPGLHWISLQYDDGDEERRALEQRHGIRLETWPDLDLHDDFDAQAALATKLDLVIGPANTPVVLAAALGTPAIFLWSGYLRIHWRDLGQPGLPWFPGVTLVHHRWNGDWSRDLASLTASIGNLPDRRSGSHGTAP